MKRKTFKYLEKKILKLFDKLQNILSGMSCSEYSILIFKLGTSIGKGRL